MVPDVQQPLSQIPSDTASPLLILPPPVPSPSPVLRPVETPVVGAPGMGSVSTEPDDVEGLKHLEQVQINIFLFSFLSNCHKNLKALNEYSEMELLCTRFCVLKKLFLCLVFICMSNCLSNHFMLLSFCYVVVIKSDYFLLF